MGPEIGAELEEALARVYRRATDLGLLGPRESDHVVERSRAYADRLVGLADGALVADLGSGAGVPGLVVAVALPAVAVHFVEISERRCAFLRWAVRELVNAASDSGDAGALVAGLSARGEVVHADAAEAGHDPARREHYDVVVARSFRSPAVTAETASGLLRVGGRLLVSGTPGDEDRWPTAALTTLGLEVIAVDDDGPLRLREIAKTAPLAPDRPRPVREISWG